jgi:hypothetical protein
VSILRFLVRPGHLTHTMPDPIILSNGESIGVESETDYGNLDAHLTAKGDSYSPYITDRDLAGGDGFSSRTTFISDRFVANYQDNGNDNGGADGASFQFY